VLKYTPFFVILFFYINGCVTNAEVGEYQVPQSQIVNTGGAGGLGASGGAGAVAGYGTTANAGSGGSLPTTGINIDPCVVKNNPDDFQVKPCSRTSEMGETDLVQERSWMANSPNENAWGTPIVANLIDDDADGDIDLCDTPDIIVVAEGQTMNEYGGLLCLPFNCYWPLINVIDGKSGMLREVFPIPVYSSTTPAVGDIDRDGSPDVVAASRMLETSSVAKVIAFERNGTTKWIGNVSQTLLQKVDSLAITLADLDNNGSVEVINGVDIFDGKTGYTIVSGDDIIGEFPTFCWNSFRKLSVAPIAADLDGDGDLEVIIGPIAFHHDGRKYYEDRSGFSVYAGWLGDFAEIAKVSKPDYTIYPLVADLDDDMKPEVLFTAGAMIYVLENDGSRRKIYDLSQYGITQLGPPTVNDFNGDGKPEIAVGVSSSTSSGFFLFDRNITLINKYYTAKGDPGCTTSFDFQGSGVADVVYSDGSQIMVFDAKNWKVLASYVREGSKDCAVIADVNNDGSAEIITVNQHKADGITPTLQIIGDSQKVWPPTRHIWNEFDYHVTNVGDNSKIPRYEPRFWSLLNTFRANVQTESGGYCVSSSIQ
jgi:hypothetical protein